MWFTIHGDWQLLPENRHSYLGMMGTVMQSHIALSVPLNPLISQTAGKGGKSYFNSQTRFSQRDAADACVLLVWYY